jgi:hypothetical protein
MRDDSLPAVLRRRADSLVSDGYGDVMLKPILRAADELERLEAELRKQGYTADQIRWIARGSGPIGARP